MLTTKNALRLCCVTVLFAACAFFPVEASAGFINFGGSVGFDMHGYNQVSNTGNIGHDFETFGPHSVTYYPSDSYMNFGDYWSDQVYSYHYTANLGLFKGEYEVDFWQYGNFLEISSQTQSDHLLQSNTLGTANAAGYVRSSLMLSFEVTESYLADFTWDPWTTPTLGQGLSFWHDGSLLLGETDDWLNSEILLGPGTYSLTAETDFTSSNYSWNDPYPVAPGSSDGLRTSEYDIRLQLVAPTVAPVPEPASMTLLGLGLVGVVARRVRKKRNAV